jgi:hypothetical protein
LLGLWLMGMEKVLLLKVCFSFFLLLFLSKNKNALELLDESLKNLL